MKTKDTEQEALRRQRVKPGKIKAETDLYNLQCELRHCKSFLSAVTNLSRHNFIAS